MFQRLLAALVLVSLSVGAMAEEPPPNPFLDSDWLLRVGVQRADADVRIGLSNPEFGTIPIVDFDTLGVDSEFGSVWLEGIWQAPERWSIGFNYFQSKAQGEQVTSQDIEFGDLLIPAGTGVATDFETKFYILNAYYDFFESDYGVAGVGFGVYGLDLKATLSALAGGSVAGTSETADVLAPLPTVSLYYTHAFNSRWTLSADIDYFGLSIDKYDGNVTAGSVALDYWINANWGLGLGYNHVDLDLTVDEPNFDELYKVQYDSFFLYISYGF